LSEHLEQVKFIAWFRREFNQYPIFAIPNGGKRGKREAGRLKAEGVTAGVSDLYCPGLKLWIEMKECEGKKMSKAQVDWANYVTSIGDNFILGLGYTDAKEKVLKFMLAGHKDAGDAK